MDLFGTSRKRLAPPQPGHSGHNGRMNAPCPLCHPDRETVLWQDRSARVVLVGDPAYPGFCRVIWRAHVAEMTDLAPAQRRHLMDLVFGVETALRQVLQPAKINLASLGDQVPHVHRFESRNREENEPPLVPRKILEVEWEFLRSRGDLTPLEPEEADRFGRRRSPRSEQGQHPEEVFPLNMHERLVLDEKCPCRPAQSILRKTQSRVRK